MDNIDTSDPHGYSQTFVNAAIQLTLFIGQPAVERIYEFADKCNASRSEVFNDWICDMADEVCDIWRKHLEEEGSVDFLGTLDKYADMLREILADPNLTHTPYAPNWEEFQKWQINKECDKFFDFPAEEDTGDPMDELEDAKTALANIKRILNR